MFDELVCVFALVNPVVDSLTADLYAFLVSEVTLPEASLHLDDEVEIFFALILDQYCPVEVLVKMKRLLEQVETNTYCHLVRVPLINQIIYCYL